MSSNLPEVLAALRAYELKVDHQLELAAFEISLRLEGRAKRNIVGERQPGEKAISGQPPKNRTGNLRRSIIGYAERIGFGSYAAVVGADMEYARAVEVGAPYNPPSWQNGEHFPFLQPAVDRFIQQGMVQRTVARFLGMIK